MRNYVADDDTEPTESSTLASHIRSIPAPRGFRGRKRKPVTVEGNYNGGSGEKSFYLPHPAKGTFVISEEQVASGDEKPKD